MSTKLKQRKDMENQEIKTKRCSKCGRELPLNEFYLNWAAADGLQSQCKECQRERVRIKHINKNCNPDLAQFTPRQLIEELKNRGYTGEIQYIQKIKI